MIKNKINELFLDPVYGLNSKIKEFRLLSIMNELITHHREKCEPYHKILTAKGQGYADNLAAVPFLPARLFKDYLLESIHESDRFKMLTSSGTTGQATSNISLDKYTASLQAKALSKIMQQYVGSKRLPMLIVDHPGVITDREHFSARGAGILGLSNFGKLHTYALKSEAMKLDIDSIKSFINQTEGEKILIFGFTFMVWKFFVKALEDSSIKINLSNATLIHSGGWKKLEDEAVSNEVFKERLFNATGIKRVHNFYGMVEQVGSIYVECEFGNLHTPAFSEIIIRRPSDWSMADLGETGVIQTLSSLPISYPGHSILTEDLGFLIGVDNCQCQRLGKTFKVIGRIPRSEERGCSDTFES